MHSAFHPAYNGMSLYVTEGVLMKGKPGDAAVSEFVLSDLNYFSASGTQSAQRTCLKYNVERIH